jgi:hypothetical protein
MARPHELPLTPDERIELDTPPTYYSTITASSRTLKYRRKTFEDSNGTHLNFSSHFGQRKLLMGEVEFLSRYIDNKNPLVVYAGAAYGRHINLLVQLFPHAEYHLYDSNEFDRGLFGRANVKIYSRYFTDIEAQQYNALLKEKKHSQLLFISDVRTAENNSVIEEWDREIVDNMLMQKKWVELMEPSMASLKFRLPWFDADTKYDYFDGELFIQPWAPIKSTETRLFTDGRTIKTYSPITYENVCYRHNLISRCFHKFESKIDYAGFDKCYDCHHEAMIWQKYLGLPFANRRFATLIDLLRAADKITRQDLQIRHAQKLNAIATPINPTVG